LRFYWSRFHAVIFSAWWYQTGS